MQGAIGGLHTSSEVIFKKEEECAEGSAGKSTFHFVTGV